MPENSNPSEPPELLTERLNAMGAELGRLHYQLYQNLCYVSIRWNEFKTLFATDEADIAMLNTFAPSFFGEVQQLMLNDTILWLRKLTDSAKAGRPRRRINVTVNLLPGFIGDEELKRQVRRLINQAKKKTEFSTDWRNRRLAHSDLEYAIDPDAKPLAKASKERIEAALNAIGAILNCVAEGYGLPPVVYEQSIEPLGSAAVLLRRLRECVGVSR